MYSPEAQEQGHDPVDICHAVPVTADTEADIVHWNTLTVDDDGWNGHDGHRWDFLVDTDSPCPPEVILLTPTPIPTEEPDATPTPTSSPETTPTSVPTITTEASPTPTPDMECISWEVTAETVMNTGEPIPGAVIEVYDGDTLLGTITTGEDGLATLQHGITEDDTWARVVSAPPHSWRYTEDEIHYTVRVDRQDECAGYVQFIDPPEQGLLGIAGIALLWGAAAWTIGRLLK